MKVVVISSKERFKSEIPHVCKMFDLGLETFHLRKPKFSEKRMEQYLQEIPKKFHSRIVIHSFHNLAKSFDLKGVHLTKRHKRNPFRTFRKLFWLKLLKRHLTVSTSCHDLFKLLNYSKKYDYVFLSPVFDSISKVDRHAGYSQESMKKILLSTQNNVLALGGVNISKLEITKKIGFDGVVLLGAIWNSDEQPVEAYQRILEAIDNNVVVA